MRKPSIVVPIIARNEERDLPACLRSVASFAHAVVLVDTGSTDRTLEVAQRTIRTYFRDFTALWWERYLDASEPDPTRPGEWRLVNFSAARNRALELARETGCTHLFWMDADDVVETPLAVRRAAYLPRACYGMWIELDRSGQRQVHHRMFPAEA